MLKGKGVMLASLTNRMWFSVVCALIDSDTRHHSGQNVVDSRGAAGWLQNKFWPLWWRVSLWIRVQATPHYISICFFTIISTSKKCVFFRARAEKGIAWQLDSSSVVWTLINNGKLANQIARLVAIVVKRDFTHHHSCQRSSLPLFVTLDAGSTLGDDFFFFFLSLRDFRWYTLPRRFHNVG